MPTQQCPVCGTPMEPTAPFCPQCGTAMAMLMKPTRTLTGIGWLDVLLGVIIGFSALMTIGWVGLLLFNAVAQGWVWIAIFEVVLAVGLYFFIRRFYPLMARGLAISGLLLLLLVLGIFWLCSGFKG